MSPSGFSIVNISMGLRESWSGRTSSNRCSISILPIPVQECLLVGYLLRSHRYSAEARTSFFRHSQIVVLRVALVLTVGCPAEGGARGRAVKDVERRQLLGTHGKKIGAPDGAFSLGEACTKLDTIGVVVVQMHLCRSRLVIRPDNGRPSLTCRIICSLTSYPSWKYSLESLPVPQHPSKLFSFPVVLGAPPLPWPACLRCRQSAPTVNAILKIDDCCCALTCSGGSATPATVV